MPIRGENPWTHDEEMKEGKKGKLAQRNHRCTGRLAKEKIGGKIDIDGGKEGR